MQRVTFFAMQEALRRGEQEVGPVHLLWGLTTERSAAEVGVLQCLGISFEAIRQLISADYPAEPATEDPDLSIEGKHCIDRAYAFAQEHGDRYIGTDHLLVGVLRSDLDGALRAELETLGLTVEAAVRCIRRMDADGQRQERLNADGGLPSEQRGLWQRFKRFWGF